MKSGAERIAAERARQLSAEGWTPGHDDEHDTGALAMAAVCYAASAAGVRVFVYRYYAAEEHFSDPWPWEQRADARPYDGNMLKTPTDAQAIRLLEKAGALIAAELDRLLRMKGPHGR